MLEKGKKKFIEDFLIPSLNSEVFGNQLQWLDRENSIFQMSWYHKSWCPEWSEVEAQVFVEWDKMKGHYQPNEKKYFSNSKQRFRALLYKLSLAGQIKKIKSDVKFKKVFCLTGVKKPRKKKHPSKAGSNIINAGVKKRRRKKHSSKDGSIIISTDDMSSANNEIPSEDANGDEVNKLCNVSDEWADVAFGRTRDQLELTERARLAVRDFLSSEVNSSINNLNDHNYSQYSIDDSANKHREENRKSIPTPVTCRITPHTPVVPEPSSCEESDSSPPSPECCVTYEGFDETDLELSKEYFRALNASCEGRMQDTDLSKSAIQILRIVKVEEDGG